jgi:hypothetical protein
MVSRVRSYSWVVFGDSCAALGCAFSRGPPFARYAVMLVAWQVWQQTGHRSLAMVRRYIREGSLFRDNPAAKLGL